MALKITPEHQKQLTDALETHVVAKLGLAPLQEELRKRYGMGQDVRVRWNALYAIPYDVRRPIIDAIYEYANDDHIDSLLRQWVTTTLNRTA